MIIKTMEGWEKSGLFFSDYVKAGDSVDTEIADLFYRNFNVVLAYDYFFMVCDQAESVDGFYHCHCFTRVNKSWIYGGIRKQIDTSQRELA